MALDPIEQQRLFNNELPKWEGIIASLAYNLLSSKPIDKGLLEMQDVQNMLRMSMYEAIGKFDPNRGTALNTWITDRLRQDCSLLTQAHYNKVPRGKRKTLIRITNLTMKDRLRRCCVQAAFNREVIPECVREAFKTIDLPLAREATVEIKKCCRRWYINDSEETFTAKQLKYSLNIDQEGKVLALVPLVSYANETDRDFLDITDPNAEAAYDEVFTKPWFRSNTDLIFSVLKNNSEKGGLNEKKAFAMILSGRYGSDKEIADLLEVNFAKVGEVRFKAKIVFAIMENISIRDFSRAQNAVGLAKRLRALLAPHVEELPEIVL